MTQVIDASPKKTVADQEETNAALEEQVKKAEANGDKKIATKDAAQAVVEGGTITGGANGRNRNSVSAAPAASVEAHSTPAPTPPKREEPKKYKKVYSPLGFLKAATPVVVAGGLNAAGRIASGAGKAAGALTSAAGNVGSHVAGALGGSSAQRADFGGNILDAVGNVGSDIGSAAGGAMAQAGDTAGETLGDLTNFMSMQSTYNMLPEQLKSIGRDMKELNLRPEQNEVVSRAATNQGRILNNRIKR
jgi:hypothetical protein